MAPHRFSALTLVVVLVAGCGGAAPSAPSDPPASPIPAPTLASATPATSPAAPSAAAVGIGEAWIVYSTAYGNGTGILLVRPDGPEPHRLLDIHAEHPDWSPDGAQVVLVAEPTPAVSEIRAVGADGTNAGTLVACVAAPCVGFAAPSWSPDGRHLVFQRYLQPTAKGYEDDQIAIEVLNLETGQTRVVAMSPVVSDRRYTEYVYPRWSPDGKQIVFAIHTYPIPPTDENILSSSIAIVRADGSDVDAPRVLTDPALFGSYPDWSPDGASIVFNTYPIGSFQDTTMAQNLYLIRPDGTGLTQITHFGENDARAVEPSWTPDGRHIIFVHIARTSSDPLGERRIAFIDPDGSNVAVLEWFGTHPRLRPT